MDYRVNDHGGISFVTVDVAHQTYSATTEKTLRKKEWTVIESRFNHCRFEGLKVNKFAFAAGRGPTEYLDCVFENCDLRSMNPGDSKFIRCDFRDVTIRDWKCLWAEFVDCQFSGELHDVNFNRRVRSDKIVELGRSVNLFEGNDFSQAQFRGVSFLGGVDLAKQALPLSQGYFDFSNAAQLLPLATRNATEWPDSEEKFMILGRLDSLLKWYVADGQDQLLLSPLDWTSRDGTKERAFEQMKTLLTEAIAQLGS